MNGVIEESGCIDYGSGICRNTKTSKREHKRKTPGNEVRTLVDSPHVKRESVTLSEPEYTFKVESSK